LRNHAGRIVLLAIAAIGAIATGIHAGERPAITDAELYVNGEHVQGRLSCRNLFSEQVTGTVQSGLPAVVELLYELLDHRGKRVHHGLHAWEITYDVWGDVYTVNQGDTALSFTTFEQMSAAVENLRGVSVAPLNALDGQAEYAVTFAIAIYPLRGTEEAQIVGWVDEQVGGGANRSWRERVLDIGDLVHRLFSRDRDTSAQSEWFQTPAFQPASLRHDRGEAPGNRERRLHFAALGSFARDREEVTPNPGTQGLARKWDGER